MNSTQVNTRTRVIYRRFQDKIALSVCFLSAHCVYNVIVTRCRRRCAINKSIQKQNIKCKLCVSMIRFSQPAKSSSNRLPRGHGQKLNLTIVSCSGSRCPPIFIFRANEAPPSSGIQSACQFEENRGRSCRLGVRHRDSDGPGSST